MFGLNGKPTWIIVFVLAAVTAVFILLYLKYQRSVERREKDREQYLVRAGRLELRKRYYDAYGNLRPDLFDTEARIARMPDVDEENDDGSEQDEPNDGPCNNGDAETGGSHTAKTAKKKDGGVVQQLMRTVTSGRLVHMINNFQLKTNRLAQRFEQPLSPEDRARRERFARLADESVNPLFSLRVRQAEIEQEEREREAHEQEVNRATATAAVRSLNAAAAAHTYAPQALDTLAQAMTAINDDHLEQYRTGLSTVSHEFH